MSVLDRLLRVSSQLMQVPGAAEPGVAHVRLRSSVPMNEEGWALLDEFRAPTTPRAVIERLGATGEARQTVELAIARFVEAGLLVEPDETEYLHQNWLALATPLRPTFLPRDDGFLYAPGGAGSADFQVLGVALDRAARVAGAARGPAAIREASNVLPAFLDPRTGEFRGLWDHTAERVLLEGVTLRDHGNVYLDAAGSLTEAFESIFAAVARMLGDSPGTPIVLGGDHSITEPVLRALTRARGPIFVVHFDAHTDMSPAYRGRAHHHGSVMDVVRRLELVRGILQIGVRDLGPPWWKPADKTRVVSAEHARRMSGEELVSLIPEDAVCYLSIDVDVLDPSEAPGTGCPVPAGLRLVELERLLDIVASARTIAGIDLVEVAPELDRAQLTSMCAVRALLRVMDAIDRRAPRALRRMIRARLAEGDAGA